MASQVPHHPAHLLAQTEVVELVMQANLRELKSDFKLGCITNNVKSSSEENTDNETKEAMSIFDHVIESSIVGIRKPKSNMVLEA